MLAWPTAVPDTYRCCIGGRKEGRRPDPLAARIHGAQGIAPTVLPCGDCHSAVPAKPLGTALAPDGIALRELSGSACMPVNGGRNTALKRSEYCAIRNRPMLDYMVTDPDLRVVADGQPLFLDADHLSLAGSAPVAGPLAEAVLAADPGAGD